MNVLPIVEREMRINARRPATYYTRCLTAALAAITAITLLYAGFARLLTPGSAGQGLFQAMAAVGFIYAIFEGAILTADSLSRERREDTLGLLFLTNLKARDIVAGKLSSSIGRAMYSLMAALPIPGLTIFLGGVTLRDLLMMMAAVLNALFFSTAIGLCVSAYVKSERKAFALTLGSVLFAGVLWPIVGLTLQATLLASAGPLFLLVSPAGPLAAALNFGGTRFPAPDFWASMAVTQGIAWGLLIMAGRALHRSWRDSHAQTATPAPVQPRIRRGKRATGSRLTNSWRRLWLDRNPIVWLGERAGNPRRLVVSMLIASVVVNLPFLAIDFGDWFGVALLACNSLVFHAMCGASAFNQICRSVIEDRESGALELLLTTRLDQDEVIDGRLLAQMRLLIPPLCLVLINDATLLAALWIEYPHEAAAVGTMLTLGWMAVQYPGHVASCWYGLWRGFKAASAAAATRQFSFLILGTPTVLFMMSIALWGILTGGRGFHAAFLGIAMLWALILLFVAGSFYLGLAVSELRDDFRALALMNPATQKTSSGWWMPWRRRKWNQVRQPGSTQTNPDPKASP